MKKFNTSIFKRYSSALLASATTLTAAFVFSLPASAAALTPITSQMDQGSQGVNVTNLQMFLATDASIYPSGLVTGYYGPLTAAAVSRLQAKYGLDQVGRVGPLTMSRINSLIAGGTGATTGDLGSPWLSGVSQSVTATAATFTWTTNENTTSKVFYNTSPVTMNEGDINSVGFGSTNGSTAIGTSVPGTAQQVVLSGLQPNTKYYYVLVSTDATGNVSVWNPNTTFTTPSN